MGSNPVRPTFCACVCMGRGGGFDTCMKHILCVWGGVVSSIPAVCIQLLGSMPVGKLHDTLAGILKKNCSAKELQQAKKARKPFTFRLWQCSCPCSAFDYAPP